MRFKNEIKDETEIKTYIIKIYLNMLKKVTKIKNKK